MWSRCAAIFSALGPVHNLHTVLTRIKWMRDKVKLCSLELSQRSTLSWISSFVGRNGGHIPQENVCDRGGREQVRQ